MSRPATSRLKVNPPLGRMPTLQFVLPSELSVDAAYQRSIDGGDSQGLIRRIAQFWNWDLCQPLVVSRRDDGKLYVIDGQHRLEAARLRGDIPQLPCVIVSYTSAADEAASFVHLNQQRRPLKKIDIFRAIASEDPEASAIAKAVAEAGLSFAPHNNVTAWKPGQVANIGGIEAAWRRHGPKVTEAALRALAQAFDGQILQYAGTLFPGIAAVCSDEMRGRQDFDRARFDRFLTMLSLRKQVHWRNDMMQARAKDPNLKFAGASARVVLDAWARANGAAPAKPAVVDIPRSASIAQTATLVAVAPFDGARWCDQCDMRVEWRQAEGCKSRFCSLKKPVAA